jgi:hypothetical protein
MSEYLFHHAAAKQISQAELDETQKYFDTNIANDPMTIYSAMRTPAYFAGVLKVVSRGKIKP